MTDRRGGGTEDKHDSGGTEDRQEGEVLKTDRRDLSQTRGGGTEDRQEGLKTERRD